MVDAREKLAVQYQEVVQHCSLAVLAGKSWLAEQLRLTTSDE